MGLLLDWQVPTVSLVGFKKPRLLSHPQTMGIFYLLFMPEGQIKNLLTLKYVCYIVTWLFNLLYLCMCTVLLLTQVSFKVTIICLGVFFLTYWYWYWLFAGLSVFCSFSEVRGEETTKSSLLHLCFAAGQNLDATPPPRLSDIDEIA